MKYFFMLLVLCHGFFLNAQEKNSAQKIKDAIQSGTITEDQGMEYFGMLLGNQAGQLPQSLQSSAPIKCGFPIIADLKAYQKKHPEKTLLHKSFVQQTFYDHVFNYKGINKVFRFQYDTSGVDQIPPEDLNSNGVRDYLEEAGKAFEKAYRLQIDTLGYKEPFNFQSNGFYEVTIRNISEYGFTEWDSDPRLSFITIDNDYSSGYYTEGYDALRVTCAHEFFHAVQLSYTYTRISDDDFWYYEVSSTWMEDVAYDVVNDYYSYLPSYFNSPNVMLNAYNGSHEYGAAVWNHYLAKKFGTGIIRQIWETMQAQSSLNALADVLQPHAGLSKAFSEFSIWNYFTKNRADETNYYSEGSNYPRIKFETNRNLADTTVSRTLPSLASYYHNFYVTDSGSCTITFNPIASGNYFEVITIEYNQISNKKYITNHGNVSSVLVDQLIPDDSLSIIIVNKEKTLPGGAPYYLSVSFNRDSVILDPIAKFHFYPNPFVNDGQSHINLKFRLRKTTSLQFEIYTMSGILVRKIDYGELPSGVYDGTNGLTWNGRDHTGQLVPSGIYIYKFTGDDFTKTGKIAIVR